ncbi:MAG: hypothetical protein LLF97_11620 [Planctomycetaceae bacterium]|nr:hypothetical protein [Planctomycetaceae bacterium]
MQEIEFLPLEYREKHARRQSRPWQIFAAMAIVGLMAAAASVQYELRHELRSELAVVSPVHEAAVDQSHRLADAQSRLKLARGRAELYTYLRHPWPRTQLLAALVERLPNAITLQQIQVVRETAAARPTSDRRSAAERKADAERLKSLGPADRDLAEIAGKLNPMTTVVVLSGVTTDAIALHHYMGELDATDVFDKAELDCFNAVEAGQGGVALQFRAVLNVLPGYGQPGGPDFQPKVKKAVAEKLAATGKKP